MVYYPEEIFFFHCFFSSLSFSVFSRYFFLIPSIYTHTHTYIYIKIIYYSLDVDKIPPTILFRNCSRKLLKLLLFSRVYCQYIYIPTHICICVYVYVEKGSDVRQTDNVYLISRYVAS